MSPASRFFFLANSASQTLLSLVDVGRDVVDASALSFDLRPSLAAWRFDPVHGQAGVFTISNIAGGTLDHYGQVRLAADSGVDKKGDPHHHWKVTFWLRLRASAFPAEKQSLSSSFPSKARPPSFSRTSPARRPSAWTLRHSRST